MRRQLRRWPRAGHANDPRGRQPCPRPSSGSRSDARIDSPSPCWPSAFVAPRRASAVARSVPTRVVAPRSSGPAPLPLSPAQPPREPRPEIVAVPLGSPSSSGAPDATNRLGLALDVREEVPVTVPLQPLLDERPEDDLDAHRELQRGRRLPRQDPCPVQGVLGENQEDSGLVREHPRRPSSRQSPGSFRYITSTYYIIYSVIPSRIKGKPGAGGRTSGDAPSADRGSRHGAHDLDRQSLLSTSHGTSPRALRGTPCHPPGDRAGSVSPSAGRGGRPFHHARRCHGRSDSPGCH